MASHFPPAAYNAGGSARITFQLAHALEEGGQLLAAQKLYAESAAQGHTASMVRLGRQLDKRGGLVGALPLYKQAGGDLLAVEALRNESNSTLVTAGIPREDSDDAALR